MSNPEATTTATAGDASTTTTASTTTAAAAATDSKTTTASGEGEGQGTAGTTATDATKANADDGKDAGTKKDEAQAPAGAPEAYAAFELPEGYVLEGERADRATALFKAKNLSQADAQDLINEFVKADSENRSMLTEMLEAQTAKRIEDWGTETKQQLGDKYVETLAAAKRAVVAYEPDMNGPAHKAFNELGWGNHPELVKMIAFFGKRITGDSLEGVGGDGAGNGSPGTSIEERMYPGMVKK